MKIMLKNPSTVKINLNNTEIHTNSMNDRKNRTKREDFDKIIEKTVE